MSEEKRSRKARVAYFDVAILSGIAAIVIAMATSLGSAVSSAPHQAPTPLTMTMSASPSPVPSPQVTTQKPSPTASSAPSPKETEQSKPMAAPPLRVVYAAAGIDLPIAPLNQAAGFLDPPLVKTSAYWVNQFGQPGEGSGNTTYIVAHSGEAGGWPFNALSLTAKVGDAIEVYAASGVVRYRVTAVEAYTKDTLGDNTKTSVWDVDGRLLRLISCKSGDVWQQNVVVTATLL